MNNIRTFQVLVVASTAIYVFWFFLPYWPGYLSDGEYRLAEYHGYGALLPVHHVLYYGTWFGLWIISAIGLFFFQNWARHFFLTLTLLGPVLAPFSGFAVQPPIDVLFSTTNVLLDGAILAMAYLSPLSVAFKTVAPNKPLEPTR